MVQSQMRSIPAFTPAMLSTFERCPQQYYLKYVKKQKVTEPFNPELACGNAAHAVLQDAVAFFGQTNGCPTGMALRGWVEDALPAAPYAGGEAWALDVDRVLTWVKDALSSLDETAGVLAVERWFEYPFPGNGECPPFRLRHRVDLVLEHEDATLEHRDWKAGKRLNVDLLQHVAARIVVRHAYPEHAHILSSTVFVAHGVVQIDELTREQVCAEWGRIKQIASRILTERKWFPVSNPLCPWCPFYQRGCPLYGSPEGGPDSTTGWLEGAE